MKATMDRGVVFVFIVAVASVIGAVSAGPIDIDAILSDDDKLQEMLKCFMADTEEDCDEQAKMLKEKLPSIVQTNCGDCDPEMAAGVLHFFQHMAKNHKEKLESFMMKYDRNGDAMKKWGATWRSQGVAI